MGRPPRLEYHGAIYHVIQRGNNREFIFDGYSEKKYLLDKIKKYKGIKDFKLFAYVIMGNHYHLLIQTFKDPLSKIMHLLNNSYGKYYNRRLAKTGHVFESRYKALPVQDERYLLGLVRYIHNNPVRANICKKAYQYIWSSDLDYRRNNSCFVDIDTVLTTLSADREKALVLYKEFMEQDEDADFYEKNPIGDANFQAMVMPRKIKKQRKRLDEILIETGVSLNDYKLIKRGSRKRRLIPFKIRYIREAVKYSYTYREIGENINISASAVAKLLEK